MDLTTLRNNYAIGAYPANRTSNVHTPETIALIWKSILKSSKGDVSQCAAFLQSLPNGSSCSELLKKSLMLWSKSFKSSTSSPTSSSSAVNEIKSLKELAGKAHEMVELDQEERDQIILTCAEAILLSNNNHEEVFSLLKLLKASNLDCQVMYLDILVQRGQLQAAQDRLAKMKNIPAWKDDVRFLLAEALLGLHSSDPSSIKDALYSYQELIQVHGETPFLLVHLAAAYILIGKYQEANNTLQQITLESSEIVEANLLVTSALLNGDFALNEFKAKYPASKLLNL